jgi:hypothetical protein
MLMELRFELTEALPFFFVKFTTPLGWGWFLSSILSGPLAERLLRAAGSPGSLECCPHRTRRSSTARDALLGSHRIKDVVFAQTVYVVVQYFAFETRYATSTYLTSRTSSYGSGRLLESSLLVECITHCS